MAETNSGSNIEVKLDDVRLSFFHGFKPQERRNDKTKELTGWNYNTSVLLNKKDQAALIEKIKGAMKQARDAKWGDNAPRIPLDRMCLRDGEPPLEEGGPAKALYDGYEGCMYLSANRTVSIEDYELIKKGEKKRPIRIIGPRKGPDGRFADLVEGSEFAPYSGCYANVIVRVYAFSSDDFPARINASLEAVQFRRHGEPFGAAALDVNNAFDEVEGEDDMGGEASSSKPAPASADDFLG